MTRSESSVGGCSRRERSSGKSGRRLGCELDGQPVELTRPSVKLSLTSNDIDLPRAMSPTKLKRAYRAAPDPLLSLADHVSVPRYPLQPPLATSCLPRDPRRPRPGVRPDQRPPRPPSEVPLELEEAATTGIRTRNCPDPQARRVIPRAKARRRARRGSSPSQYVPPSLSPFLSSASQGR